MIRPITAAAFLILSTASLIAACQSENAAHNDYDAPQQTISGTFEGLAEDGEEIVLNIDQSGDVVSGSGSSGGHPLVISGLVSLSAFTTLTQQNGSVSGAYLGLSGKGDALTVRRRGHPDLILSKSDSSPAAPTVEGPFSGLYEARESGKLAGTASIVQHRDLIYGMAELLGEAAGVSARLVDPNRAEGVLTFLDRSQVRFIAEFSDGGESAVLRGFGAPIELKKVEGAAP